MLQCTARIRPCLRQLEMVHYLFTDVDQVHSARVSTRLHREMIDGEGSR